MDIKWITLMVNYLEDSKKFYENFLGFTKVREFSPSEELDIVFYQASNGMEIELIKNKQDKESKKDYTGVSFGIVAENYDELLEKSKKWNVLSAPPQAMGDMVCFFIKDPNNVEIQIIKP